MGVPSFCSTWVRDDAKLNLLCKRLVVLGFGSIRQRRENQISSEFRYFPFGWVEITTVLRGEVGLICGSSPRVRGDGLLKAASVRGVAQFLSLWDEKRLVGCTKD